MQEIDMMCIRNNQADSENILRFHQPEKFGFYFSIASFLKRDSKINISKRNFIKGTGGANMANLVKKTCK